MGSGDCVRASGTLADVSESSAVTVDTEILSLCCNGVVSSGAMCCSIVVDSNTNKSTQILIRIQCTRHYNSLTMRCKVICMNVCSHRSKKNEHARKNDLTPVRPVLVPCANRSTFQLCDTCKHAGALYQGACIYPHSIYFWSCTRSYDAVCAFTDRLFSYFHSCLCRHNTRLLKHNIISANDVHSSHNVLIARRLSTQSAQQKLKATPTQPNTAKNSANNSNTPRTTPNTSTTNTNNNSNNHSSTHTTRNPVHHSHASRGLPRELLSSIVSHFPKTEFAMAYGSAVLPQLGYTASDVCARAFVCLVCVRG